MQTKEGNSESIANISLSAGFVRSGSRLCENSDAKPARKLFVSILSLRKPNCTGKCRRPTALEETILCVRGSDAFSHCLRQKLT